MEQRLRAFYLQAREHSDDPDSVVLPNVKITGENYEVGGAKAFIANLVGYIRLLGFAILFMGESVCNVFGGISRFPSIVKDGFSWVQENKMQFGIMCFFLTSMV